MYAAHSTLKLACGRALSCKLFIIEINLLLLLSACKRNMLDVPGQTHVHTCPLTDDHPVSKMGTTVSTWFKLYASKLPEGWYNTCYTSVALQGFPSPWLRNRYPSSFGSAADELSHRYQHGTHEHLYRLFLSSRLFWTCCFRLVIENSHILLQLSFIGLLWALPTSLF